jgi:hypothetical protein
VRTPEEINAEFEALVIASAQRQVPSLDAPSDEWAALARAQEADHLRRAELLDEMLSADPGPDLFIDAYAYTIARDACREAATEAAERAETFEAQAGGPS